MTNRDLIKIRKVQVAFEALSIEGGLLSPEWLSKTAQLHADAQSETDYKVPKGLTLRDEIGRYWRIAEALWNDYQAKLQGDADGTQATETFIGMFLQQCLGFDDLQTAEKIIHGEHLYPVRHTAGKGLVPVVISSPHEGLDQLAPRFGEEHRKRTAFGLLQEYLNASDQVLWGLACDGDTLRIVRDNVSLTRPAWIEADLKRLFQEARFADFAALWLICHRTRFGETGQPPNECVLERWREASRNEGTRARNHLRIGVEEALEILGQGFISHADNQHLRELLQSGALSTQIYFQELLRLIYRVIFLITIEERGLLHPAATTDGIRLLYQDGYGFKRLRDRAIKRNAYDRFSDLWESLKIVFRGVGKGEPRLGLPALGGLFGDDQTPTLMAAKIENRYLLQAVLKLCWLKEESGVSRVNWRDMGPEELGSVYEGLLELVPQLSDHGRQFSFARGDETKGNVRKLTSSYYTPDSLVQSLLDTALEPVIAATIASHANKPDEALLELSIIDPACGSGHFLLAAARRLAVHLARIQVGGTPTAQDYRKAMRQVISRCIYGVDKNPMALELARTALWLEAMTTDAPLSFVDHHLICGDALLGLIDLSILKDGIPNEAFKALAGDDKECAKELSRKNSQTIRSHDRAQVSKRQDTFVSFDSGVLDKFTAVERMSDDTLEASERKRAVFEAIQADALDSDKNPISLAADMFMTAFLSKKTIETVSLVPTTVDIAKVLQHTPISNEMKAFVLTTVKSNRTLHWKLRFAHIFKKGGFDVVLGNPPWEVQQLSEEEYFSGRDPEIAVLSGAARKRTIALLAETNQNLWNEFQNALFQFSAANRFFRDSGRYPLTAIGKLNSYPLFTESGLTILAHTGRCGLVIPSGIATDDSTSKFFSHISGGRIISLVSFEEIRQWFHSTDDRRSFCLLTLGSSPSAYFAFGLKQLEELSREGKKFSLTAEDIKLLNPNTRTCPIFRSGRDAEITKKIYRRVSILWDENDPEGNPWGLNFRQGLFNMTSDSELFHLPHEKSKMVDPLPLYEAKMIHQFDHRWATYCGGSDDSARDVTELEKRRPEYEPSPRYWVERSEVDRVLSERQWKQDWLLGWRDITKATVERTMIATIFPRVGVGNNLSLMFPNIDLSLDLIFTLLGNLCSLVLDYVTRLKVGGSHINFFIAKQLPVIAPDSYQQKQTSFISTRVFQLICSSLSLKGLGATFDRKTAYRLGWDQEQRNRIRGELDAYFAALYGLSRDELRFVLDPADVLGEKYPTETFRVLKEKEIRLYGEYRTRKTVLEAWDSLEKSGELPNPVEARK